MKRISKFIFNKILGWRVRGEFPVLSKCVIAVAQHTSNWDFPIAKLGYASIGRTANFLIKAEWFIFPFNLIFKSMGGIPVAREKNTSLTDSLAAEFNRREQMQQAITREGPRRQSREWKRGCYDFADKAGITIFLVGLDYQKKEAIALGVIYPSGDYEKDIEEIKSRYRGIQGKKPKNFLL